MYIHYQLNLKKNSYTAQKGYLEVAFRCHHSLRTGSPSSHSRERRRTK